MTNNFGNFHGKAHLYAKYRPRYSKEYQTFLQNHLGINRKSTVADIGAGTGIHTKAISNFTGKIFAIEPDQEMLEQCKSCFEGNSKIVLLQGSAEKTGLPSACVDFITVAQAFHLFPKEESLKEFKRILRPNGKLILTWNSKEHDNQLFYDSEEIITKYCPLYDRNIHAREFYKDSYHDCFTSESYTYIKFSGDSTEYLDKETFIMRTMSASYAIRPDNMNYNNFIKGLEQVFDHHSINDVVKVPQSTVIYYGYINNKGDF